MLRERLQELVQMVISSPKNPEKDDNMVDKSEIPKKTKDAEKQAKK